MPVDVRVRPPAVAGAFYPAEPSVLATLIDGLLAQATHDDTRSDRPPKALIVPHAGYVYSGAIAASAYARLLPFRGRITRAVLLGPAHRVWIEGLALPDADALDTPLGRMRVVEIRDPAVSISRHAHAQEHALEVHLPFLQRVLGDVDVLPLVVGAAPDEMVARVIEHAWGDASTIVIISSDLSHYHDWDDATRRDARAAGQIEALGPPLTHEQACGATPINGLLLVAQRKGLRVERLDLRNSGDTAGPRDRVVGYGAFAFYEHGAAA